eukprot:15534659-Heterocapsa_arctica.AAC.1
MSTAPKEDHRVIAAHVVIQPVEKKKLRDIVPGRTWFNSNNLHDPMMMNELAKMMWQFNTSAGCSIDAHLEELTSHIKVSAKKAYGRPVCAPRKPWISA